MDFKYFWTSGFLYIATIVPMIWVLELNLLNERQNVGSTRNTTANGTTENLRLDELVMEALRASNIDARKFSEIGVMICLIAGRWLAPRAFLSRNQLSALLLGYVSNAADILELFESLQSPNSEIVFHVTVTYAILGVYTWAILQFTLVTTATSNWREPRVNSPSKNVEPNTSSRTRARDDDVEENPETVTHIDAGTDETDRNSRYGAINPLQSQQEEEYAGKCCKCFTAHPEHFQILVTLLMQDGPFLVLRLIMTIKFNFVTELHIFFLCKNAVVCLLLLHRLCVLGCDDDAAEEEYEDKTKNDITNTVYNENFEIGTDNPVPVEGNNE